MEQRKFPRVPVCCSIAISEETLDGAALGTGFNLSLGGCELASNLCVPKGTHVSLRIHLEDPKLTVEIKLAKVRWSMGRVAGLEFIQIEPEAQMRLRQFFDTVDPLWLQHQPSADCA